MDEWHGGRVDVLTASRADRHAAQGDPARLAIIDELFVSDRAPGELQALVELPSNLVAHHLDVLERVGLVTRSRSSGDGRRRYVHLHRRALADLTPGARLAVGPALFVCTHNAARPDLRPRRHREGGVMNDIGDRTATATAPTAVAAPDGRRQLVRRAVAEGVGTALLVAVVVGSGIFAEQLSTDPGLQLLENSIATGAGLIALILAFGPVSGAHFNPVVTLADRVRGITTRDASAYIAAQVIGGCVGTVLANLMFDLAPVTLSTHAGDAHVLTFVPLLAERFARQRLRALAKVEGRAGDGLPTVLFLRVHNAGRSQMALGWFSHLAGDRAVAWSGGSEPGAEVNPSAIAAMDEVGIDIREEYPKHPQRPRRPGRRRRAPHPRRDRPKGTSPARQPGRASGAVRLTAGPAATGHRRCRTRGVIGVGLRSADLAAPAA